MIELNLLPDVKRQLVRAQRTRKRVIASMVLVCIICAGAIVLLAVYTYGGQLAINKVLDGTIEQKTKELAKKENINYYLTVQNQLKALPELHSKKMIYSRIFDYLPIVNPASPNDIRVTRLNADETQGSLTINGYGKDYKAVTIFENTLKGARLSYESDNQKQEKPFLRELSMSQVGFGEDTTGNKVVTFTATLMYAPEAFSRDTGNPRIVVPSQSSNQATTQLFGQTSRQGAQ